MATYSAGTSIAETGSLKRTTAGTTSKTLGANEYALVSFYHPKHDDSTYEGSNSMLQDASLGGSTNTTNNVAMTGWASGQYLVGGGITFSITLSATVVSFTIDGVVVYTATTFETGDTADHPVTAQYVVFS